MNRTLRYTMIAGALAMVLAIAFALGTPRTASAEDASRKLISVLGEAKVEVKPDMATLSFGVENTAKTAEEAQQENSRKMNAVVEAILGMGIAKEDVKTSNFSLYPVYDWQDGKPNRTQVLVGYRCNNTVTVKLKDIGRIGPAIDKTVAAGATNVSGLSFGLQDPEAHRDALLTSAIKDAQSKAQAMAKAAGITITGIHRISDSCSSVQPMERRDIQNLAVGQAPVIEAGSLTIRASVRVDFAF